MHRTYSELIKIKDFEDRFDYLRLNGVIGESTFGGHRYLNQALYQSYAWKTLKRKIILRDNGCDLGHCDYPIYGPIYIHHINPITIEDIIEKRPCVFDLENLICSSFYTHNAIHYGTDNIASTKLIERKKNDTCPWR